MGVEIIEKAWNTQPVHQLNDTLARLFRLKGAVLNPEPANWQAWEAAITAGSAATRKPIAPVLVCIEARDYPNDDHFSLPQSCVADAQAWLADLTDESSTDRNPGPARR